jgi:hypothetical protein
MYYLQPSTTLNPSRESNNQIAGADQANFVVAAGPCTALALNVGANNYNTSAADTSTVTVYQNSIATAMTCSVATNGNGAGCADTTDTFSVAAGDTLSLQYTETSNTPLIMLTATLVCQ